MTKLDIELQCRKKADELLEKYFPDFAGQAASGVNERLSSEYTDDLPRKIAEEYKEFLSILWQDYGPAGGPSFEEIMNLHRSLELTDASYVPHLGTARKDAEHVSLWEKITKSNHEDVTYYVGLLKQYTEELLEVLTKDFMGDIPED